MAYISDSLRAGVIDRAHNRCEYCGLSQVGQVATFHIDHVTPVSAGGETKMFSLCFLFPTKGRPTNSARPYIRGDGPYF